MILKVIAILLSVAITLLSWFVGKEVPLWSKISVSALALILVGTQVTSIVQEKQEDATLRYVGILKGEPITMLSAQKQVYPRLKLGQSDTFFIWQGEQGEPLIKFLDDAGLTIWVDKGRLKVTTIVRNSKGEIIAEINANEWMINEQTKWDRNYNKNALEVKDDKGDIVLQVILGEGYVQLAGKFYSSTGEGFAIGSSRFSEEDVLKHEQGELKLIAAADGPQEFKVGDITGVIEVRPPGIPLELKIDPIFKYPSKLHLGELLKE